MKKVIVVAIVVVLLVLVGLVVLTSGNAKEDTMINFLTNSTLENGDSVEFQLTDSNGNPISNQEIIIALDTNGSTEKYSISTDSNGKGSLVLNDMPDGKYKVNVTYNGNDKYNPTYSVQTVVIGDVSIDDSTAQGNATSSNQTSISGNSSSRSNSNSSSSSSSSSSPADNANPNGQTSSQGSSSSDSGQHAGEDAGTVNSEDFT